MGLKQEDINAFNLDKLKETGRAYSECAKEIVEMYNQWLQLSFSSESEFLNIINNKEISIIYNESDAYVACCLTDSLNRQLIGEIFVSQSLNAEDVERFKIDLSLVLLHIMSVCENEKNKEKLKDKISEIAGNIE